MFVNKSYQHCKLTMNAISVSYKTIVYLNKIQTSANEENLLKTTPLQMTATTTTTTIPTTIKPISQKSTANRTITTL